MPTYMSPPKFSREWSINDTRLLIVGELMLNLWLKVIAPGFEMYATNR